MSAEIKKQTEDLFFRRELIKEMHRKKEESKSSKQEIDQLKSENYAIGQEIEHAKV